MEVRNALRITGEWFLMILSLPILIAVLLLAVLLYPIAAATDDSLQG